ncbi:hypothetical protein, partial [Cutibacterium acnes]|uniref:hypothetical protein n=1 Tax=Cutibacterium acnes TaxID=1747 RepID=UPI001BDC225B
VQEIASDLSLNCGGVFQLGLTISYVKKLTVSQYFAVSMLLCIFLFVREMLKTMKPETPSIMMWSQNAVSLVRRA